MNRKLYTGIGVGMAAAASIAMLTWPTKSRKRRMAMKSVGKAAKDLNEILKIF